MNRKAILCLAVAGLGLLAVMGTGCQKLRARDNLNKGVQAYRNARYPEAVEFFKKAVELDPMFPTPRLYLATAYMSQYIPGAESPENQQMATAARDQFMEVLRQDPKNTVAIASIASLLFQQASGVQALDQKLKKLDEAGEWYRKLIAIDPQNKEAYYTLGVIAWSKWYPALMTARAKLGMKPEDPGPLKDKKVREKLRADYGQVIEDGIKSLEKSLEIDKEYDDAMAYMNLLTRERADLAESAEEYKKDIETADNWIQRTLETKKIKASRAPQAAGITTEEAK